MVKGNTFFRPIVYVVLVLYIIASYMVLLFNNHIIGMAVREDQFFETVGAMAFLATSILFFICYLRSGNSASYFNASLITRLFYLGLALLFLFGAGEEINWGQRILNIQTPELIRELNKQDEISLHNLYVFEDAGFFTVDRCFDIFWFILTLALPVTCALFKSLQRFFSKFLPIVPLSIGMLFLCNYIWAKVAKFMFCATYTYENVPFRQAVQEIKESNYAILFVLVGIFFVFGLNKPKTETVKMGRS